jgi:NADP-dependent 3-hydroxy acid dehydrogenase YdfG
MNDLKDKIVMITGASSGFGKRAAKMCVALGAKGSAWSPQRRKIKRIM